MQYGMNPVGMQGYKNISHPHQTDRNNNGYSMTVEGKGQITVRPDQAKLSIGVVTENQQLLQAQQENSVISTRVIEALNQLGIDPASIKTIIYNIQPQYDYIEGKQILRGYQVEHQLEVTVKDIAKVGLILDTAFKNGANRAGNIQFIVATPEVYYREALKKALNDAREKAEVMAQTIGAALKRIPIKIIEKNVQPPEVYPMFSYKLTAEAAAVTPPIQKGEYTIDAYVTVVYEYRERN